MSRTANPCPRRGLTPIAPRSNAHTAASWLVLWISLALCAPLHAQEVPPPGAPDDAEAGAEPEARPIYESEVYGWAAPAPEEQLARDTTRVPAGRGAIFVPYMSEPEDEPEFVVFRAGRRITSASPGSRVVLEPGDYRVEMGSGHRNEVRFVVKVLPDQTTLVPVTWGGLRVEVVDERNVPHRAGYEVIRVADRDIFGVGYGADLLAGERVQTWILEPDLYRIVQPGASYRTRENYATVFVPEGGFVRYRLVVDPETGEFRGAGVVTADESGGVSGDDRFTPNLVLGVNGNLSIQQDTAATVEAFIDGGVTFRDDPHTFVSLLQIEEGMRWIDPEIGDALPIQKSEDRVRLDLLYTYDLTRVFAPYARSGVEAALFPTTVITSQAVSVTYVAADGTSRLTTVEAGSAFQTADYFGKTLFFEGAGINAWVIRNDRGMFKIGAGLGFRQSLHRGLYAETPGSVTPNLVYEEVESSFQEGVEGLFTGRVRIGKVATFTTNFEIFSDFGTLNDPTMLWENTLGFRLVEVLSLDYVLEVERQPLLYDELQVGHEILLRLAWEIL